jgi:lipid A ethanolaminephosphotransferase
MMLHEKSPMNKLKTLAGSIGSRRLQVSAEALLFGVCAFFALVFNLPFWRGASQFLGTMSVQVGRDLLLMGMVITCLHFLLLLPFVNRYTLKPILSLLVIAGAAAGYFSWYYGTYFDVSMINNVLQTDINESQELLTMHYALFMLVITVPPLILLNTAVIKTFSMASAIKRRCVSAAAVGALLLISLLVSFQTFSGLMRNHTQLRYLVNPGNLLVSVPRSLLNQVNHRAISKLPVGLDAHRTATSKPVKPRLLVLVVGETVRSANWGLNGYERDTTPKLSAVPNLVNFADVTSCGTSTAVSLPCMFSDVGKDQYSEVYGLSHESLLNVVQHASFKVKWIDNQSGCKGVCDDIDLEIIKSGRDTTMCTDGHCFDGALPNALAADLTEAPENELLILHMQGSHGPAYFRRYPMPFEVFKPACHKDEISQCSQQEVINGYDNSILYTDYVLDSMISRLKSDQTRDVALIYVSDHGESLGEMGLYLHGLPDLIAPATQTHIPMTWWLSDGFLAATGISQQCLQDQAKRTVSHDYLFHSVLGLLDIETEVYDRDLDLSQTCKT